MEFINALITGLPFLISHLFVTLCLLFIGITSYIFLTPIRELKLIKDGNVAASISFSGALLGIGIPLASSLSVSNSILEIIIWGLTAIFLQLLCFKVTDRFLKDLSGRIEDNQLAPSILLFFDKNFSFFNNIGSNHRINAFFIKNNFYLFIAFFTVSWAIINNIPSNEGATSNTEYLFAKERRRKLNNKTKK